jgi:hypothetical protein
VVGAVVTGFLQLVFVLLAFCNLAMAQTPPPQDDNQFWNEFQLIKALDKKHDLIVIGEDVSARISIVQLMKVSARRWRSNRINICQLRRLIFT